MTTNHIESLWDQVKLLSGFYNGMHGSNANIQRFCDYGLWRRQMHNRTDFELAQDLCHILRVTF